MDDREAETCDSFLLAGGNTASYASGMQICSGANIHDGTFTVVWIERLSRVKVLPMLLRVLQGRHLRHGCVRSAEIRKLPVDAPQELQGHADGEIIGHLPITLGTLPKAIRVRMGASAVHPERQGALRGTSDRSTATPGISVLLKVW